MSASVPQASFTRDPIPNSWEDPRLSLTIRRIFWFLGIVLGLLEAIASRFTMNVDGISYLDLASAYLHHDWKSAVNGYWSPLYPWLLAATMRVFHTPMNWESTLVHFLNWILFLASMAAFEFFLLEMCAGNRAAKDAVVRPLPEWAVRVFGYSLFLYAGLVWISIDIVTPDQCVAAVTYVVAGLLLRIHRRKSNWKWYILLGALLGIGYLTKAILLPIGLVTVVTIPFFATRESFSRRIANAALTAIVFAAVAAPLVIALSLSKGRLTSGDTGKIAYAQMVDGLVKYHYWQGEGNLGAPKHPARKIGSVPDVYEFAAPVGGTYPLWYDTSYWFDGLQAKFEIAGQLGVLKKTLRLIASCLLEQGPLLVVLGSLIFVDFGAYSYWRQIGSVWPVWLPGVAAVGLYALVWFEARYVASFLTIIGLLCFAAVRLTPSVTTRRVTMGLSLGAAALNLFAVGSVATRNLYSSVFRPRNTQWEVALALSKAGIRPGDGVATIIDHRMGDYWARLAQIKIIEDIPFEEAPKLASLDSDSRAQLIRILQTPGAKAVITMPEPPGGTGLPWQRLGTTDYFAFWLAEKKE